MRGSIGRVLGSFALFIGLAFACGFESQPAAELPTVTFQAEGTSERLERAEAQVDIRDFKYHPKQLEVDRGTRVTWTNFDTAEHSATDIGGDFNTGLFPKDGSRSVRLTEPGTYRYICSIHPEMRASVVVAGDGGNGGSGGNGDGSGSGGTSDGTGGVSPDGTSPATSSGTDTGTGTSTDTGTGFDTGTDTGSFSTGTPTAAEELPMTGFNALWPFGLAALLAAAGLLLAALAAHLRTY